ncbi:phosphotransferase [bacterium]|nr:phosphotransferase [bacterium]
MPEDRRIELERQSNAALETFVTKNPKFSIDAAQSQYRGGTNFITFGHYDQQPIVFKYFLHKTNYRWQNEYFCLRHFARTGYVPRILAVVPERLIVMTRLPGDNFGGVALTKQLNPDQRKQVGYEIGSALALFAQTPLPAVESGYSPVSDFKCIEWGEDLRELLKRYLLLCRGVQEVIDAYQTPFFTESLMLIESQINVIDKQPHILFHEDVSNLNIYQGVFQGFYDFEMCRLGTAAMQLGVGVGLCSPDWLDDGYLHLGSLLEGYQSTAGRELSCEDYLSILAMSHFYHHIRVCRWGMWDGDPTQEHHMLASSDDAVAHLGGMREACEVLKDWVNLSRWFPSLC